MSFHKWLAFIVKAATRQKIQVATTRHLSHFPDGRSHASIITQVASIVRINRFRFMVRHSFGRSDVQWIKGSLFGLQTT
jgi:hypothetical protein